MDEPTPRPASHRWPAHAWIGFALIGVCWPLNWVLEGNRTHVLFAPLWVGWVLFVDGWCVRRSGTSMSRRSPVFMAQLFVLSAPSWWLFEFFNTRLRNWEYVGRDEFSDLEYAILCTISFSTVMPAVLATSELARSFAGIERFERGPRIATTPTTRRAHAVLGFAMLAAMWIWPRVFYPLEWVALVFVLDPLCSALGRRSLSGELARGDWRTWIALWIGGSICGFLWELWNFWSQPKWIYHVPGVDFARVFEMPLLGYLGYLPFALELWLLAQLCLPRARTQTI